MFSILLFLFMVENTGGQEMIAIGEQITVQSEVLHEERTISICLPWGYHESDRSYPVLLILDGGTTTSCSHAVSTMEMLDGKSLAPQMIVVGIDSGTGVRDYFPLPLESRPGSGSADKFLKFLTDEILPLISRQYRTAPYTVLFGGSNAGMFTVYAMTEDSGCFSSFITGSPSLGWFPDFFLERFSSWTPDEGVRFYMNWGTDDIQSIVLSAEPQLAEAAASSFSESNGFMQEAISQGGHVPYVSLYNGLCHVFSGYRFTDQQADSGGLQVLLEHYQSLSLRYGYTILPPGGSFMTLGRNRLQQGNISEAVSVYEAYTEAYPTSARAHFFLGESYRAEGRLEIAESCYNMTLELEPSFTLAVDRLLQIREED